MTTRVPPIVAREIDSTGPIQSVNRRTIVESLLGAALGISYPMFRDVRASAQDTSPTDLCETLTDNLQTPKNEFPHPPFCDRLIPDSENRAWDDLGPRKPRGVVYHRASSPTLEFIDSFYRPSPDPPTGLVDYGVDHVNGSIVRWNDPTGATPKPYEISQNRAPWANGPVLSPTAAVADFIDEFTINAINRDLVSITVTGDLEDPVSDSCIESIAGLSAYYAVLFAENENITWIDYPNLKMNTYSFVLLHNEITADRVCPGPVVTSNVEKIVTRTRELLRTIQNFSNA